MKGGFRLIFLLSTAFLMLAMGAYSSEPPKVVATIFPLYDIAKSICGERAKVRLLLPIGANPHSWEPKPSELIELEKADLVIMVGDDFEPWADKFLSLHKGQGRPFIMRATDGAPVIRHKGKRAIDPHIWLDFEWDMVLVRRIALTLSRLDPDGEGYYKENASAYNQALSELYKQYKQCLSTCRSKTLVVGGHGAFSYLARAFGLKQVSLYGLSPDARPSPRRMAQVVQIIKSEGVSTIFFEETVTDRLAKVLSRETGAKIMTLAPGASLTKKEIEEGLGFIDLMKKNLEHLCQGLGCACYTKATE